MLTKQIVILAVAFGIPLPAHAAMRPDSKAGALEAGQFLGVAEQCITESKSVLTKAAKRFAEAAESKNPTWYYAAYNDEVKGDPSAYNEAFCNDLIRNDYGPQGVVSRRLGFTVFDATNFVE